LKQEFKPRTYAWPDILHLRMNPVFEMFQSEKNFYLRLRFQIQSDRCRDVTSSSADVSNRPAKQKSCIKSKDLGESVATQSTAQSSLKATGALVRGAFVRIYLVDHMSRHNRNLPAAETNAPDIL